MATLSTLKTGEKIGEYTFLRFLQQGGMAAVALVSLDETLFALKVSKVVANDANQTKDNMLAIRHEATFLSNLNHERLVKVFPISMGKNAIRNPNSQRNYYAKALNLGKGEMTPWFFAMEFLAGGSLARLLRRCGPLQIPEATNILGNVGLGLAYMHQKGISHNDVKAENVMFRSVLQNGAPFDPVLVDFGTATWSAKFDNYAGTWFAMAPERILAAREEVALQDLNVEKTDVWSLGVILYQAFTKQLPFPALRQKKLTKQILKGKPERISAYRKDMPKELEQFILQDCLAKKPEDRPTLEEFLHFTFDYCGRDVKAQSVTDDYVKEFAEMGALANKGEDA